MVVVVVVVLVAVVVVVVAVGVVVKRLMAQWLNSQQGSIYSIMSHERIQIQEHPWSLVQDLAWQKQ